jgi:hypothetical protein
MRAIAAWIGAEPCAHRMTCRRRRPIQTPVLRRIGSKSAVSALLSLSGAEFDRGRRARDSPPGLQQSKRIPYRPMPDVGAAGGVPVSRSRGVAGRACRAAARVGRARRSATNVPDEWPSPPQTRGGQNPAYRPSGILT